MPGILLFGGSFDPIHHGHLIIARDVAEQIGAQRTILIPAASPPHKDVALLSAYIHRLEMCRLAVRGEPGLEVSDWEGTQPGPNYTLLTVKHFSKSNPNERLYWLLGMDSLNELGTWYRVAELAELCTLVTAMRPSQPGFDTSALRGVLPDARLAELERQLLPTPRIEISATAVRERVRTGRSVRYLVPEAVYGYITQHGLYLNQGDA